MASSEPIKPIPTRYAGCHFRSRLEARWAVFFDALKVEWEYEPNGYTIGSIWEGQPRNYLPDFYLPATGQWVEVKPTDEAIDKPLMVRCVDFDFGLPGLVHSLHTMSRGLLLLGPIPKPTIPSYKLAPIFTILGHSKSVAHRQAIFSNQHPAGGIQFIRYGHDDPFARDPGNYCGLDTTIGEGDAILNGCTCPWIHVPPKYYAVSTTEHKLAMQVNGALTAARSARFGT